MRKYSPLDLVANITLLAAFPEISKRILLAYGFEDSTAERTSKYLKQSLLLFFIADDWVVWSLPLFVNYIVKKLTGSNELADSMSMAVLLSIPVMRAALADEASISWLGLQFMMAVIGSFIIDRTSLVKQAIDQSASLINKMSFWSTKLDADQAAPQGINYAAH